MTNPLPDWYHDPAEREEIRAHQFGVGVKVGGLWELSRELQHRAAELVPLSRRELRVEAARAGVKTAPVRFPLPVAPERLPMRFGLRLELWLLRRRLAWRLRGVGNGFHLQVEVPSWPTASAPTR